MTYIINSPKRFVFLNGSSGGGSGGDGISSLNSLTGDVTLVEGSGISITEGESSITIASDAVPTRSIQWTVFIPTTNVTTGDGKLYFHVSPLFNGLVINYIHAMVITAGTTGTTDIQIARIRSGSPADVLSTKLTIDSGETGSDTAATSAVINTSNDDLATNDILRIDVDAVSSTPPKGLIVTIECVLP
jgi:hypothetical protein